MTELDGLTALIIEPHAGMRASIHNMLNLCGLQKIDHANSSNIAVKNVGLKVYDMIFCEYDLEGGQDGQQLLEDMRHHRLIPLSTMFFMVTAEGNYGKVVSAAELAPTDYILKPFTADRLLERIARALEKRNVFLPVYQMMEMGAQREAIAACVEGVKVHPRYAIDFMRLRAELHMVLGEPEQAEPIYQQLFEAKAIAWARLGLAKTLYMRERYPEAQSILEQLVESNQKFVDAYDWLAKTYEAQGNMNKSQEILSSAVSVSPHAVRRLRKLGEVALETGDVDLAEKTLKQVVSKAKYSEFRDPEDHVKLVQTLVKKGDPVQAAAVIRDLDKSMGGQRNTAVCSAISSAMVHEYTGNEQRLNEALAAALNGCKDAVGLSNDLKMELARNCLANNHADGATEVMRDVMRNASNNTAMAKAMAVFEKLGHADLALSLAKESRQQVIDLVASGAAKAREGDYRGAVALMVEAVNKLPDNPQVVFNAALAVLKCLENVGWEERLGQYALSLIDTVRRLDPTNAKLPALATLHQQILKKYDIKVGARKRA
ncbi:tetratricopeptide repeat-containing response regulator [Massilia sp. TS11]|uniref:tetratricopeptide repeat-containing response regulator n=1 Tax=Massilia sp. TS11 TaxID=2908003 RepID=UPI001EDB0EDE|nr:tetratricopeptide repeat-containing response regulator [Massilia sp. TS11]MCG2584790.1 response regulator [Massilia sp. TS11]